MDKKARILLVEDDPNLGQILKEYLEVKGFEATLAPDGEAGLEVFNKDQKFDLCIFDVMMPKMDGFTLAEKVRESDVDTPIIFLTAKAMKEDTVQGFKVGADDYVLKPFSMEELMLRIKAILRRTQNSDEAREELQNEFKLGRFVFRFDAQKLIRDDGHEQRLTSKEAALLKMLAARKNRILERSDALTKIWLRDDYFNSRSMDVYITKLRKFLKSDENLKIVNVHGQGFKLVELKN
jgi:DNA-binding response OmpR family regulator